MSRDQYYEELARAYGKDQQSEKAIEYFRLALLHNPNRISARIGLSDEYRKADMNQLAANELNEALRVRPDDAEAWLKLGDLYLSAQIFLKAKQAFLRVLELDPQRDQARWLLFYVARIEKDDVAAQKYLNQIVETSQNRTKLYFEKALLAKRTNQPEKYSRLIQSAYAEEPHNKKVCLEMVNDLSEKADFESAFVVLNHFSQAHDFDLEISQFLVQAAVRTNQFEVALSELERQKQAGEKSVDIDLKSAHVFFLAGDLSGAEQVYLNVLEEDPTRDQAYFYLAQIYIHRGFEDLAKPSLRQLTPASAYFAEAQVWLAFEEMKSGQSLQALQRLEKAQARRPDQLSLYVAYADLLIREKQFEKALKVLQLGTDFFPQSEDLQIQSAVAHFQLNHEQEFKQSIAKALEINPENSEIYANLAELWYLKKFNPQDIEGFAQKALQFNTKNRNVKPLLAWALMAQDRSFGSVALFEKLYEENPNQPFYAEALARVYKAADISDKGQAMGVQALKLRNQKNLQSDLVFRFQPEPQLGSQRQPAHWLPSQK